ncbi:MAG: hypothetical protein KC609_04200, partial [Myxococcales bacterium]|nr:hypothetical protein [Myxococcales bacterium]
GVTPGLGSSAAVVSAAVAALHAIDWGPDGARESHGAKGQRLLPPEVLFAEAFAAHHRAQRGKGSGCDVAAACFGGLVGYRRRGDALPSVELLDLGALPPLAAAHAGPKASTTQLIEAVERAGQQAPAALRDVRSALDGAAQRAIAAIRGREGVRAILAALADSSRALSELDRLADGRLEPAPVRELLRIARDEAAVAKISGAGGGDCVLAFAEHPDRITRVKALWARAGYRVLDLLPAMNGARLEDETIEKLPKAAT